MKPQKSFTLIELLVVISVIGLLSSIVLVSTKGIREKARIAKTLEFSQSLQNALGSEAVAIWNFDENSGTVAKDSSGYGNNGTLYSGAAICANPPTAGCPTWTDDTPQKIIGQGSGKYALSFDGTNDYIDAGSNFSVAVPYTVTGWVKIPINPGGQNRYLVDFAVTGGEAPAFSPNFWTENKPLIYLNTENYRYGTSNLADNQWHNIVFVVTGSGINDIDNAKIYVDGKEEVYGGKSKSNSPISPTGRAHIGTGLFKGLADEVRVYSKALTIGEIQKRYAEGLEKHKNLAQQ